MDYKDTLNLPRTDFPMKADLVAREPERLKQWEEGRLYEKIQKQRAGAEKFVLHDGPPFANGDVHIGTALNKILKDIIVKYQTLRGKSAPYIPGWDCHGLPIEFKVSQELRKAGDTSADAVAIRKACDAYARKYIDLQRIQFKRLGVLGDWDNPYLTLNKEYEADELRLFADIVEKGFVYRGKKPIYWSIPARTALAEAEVEYHDHVSPSIYVKFPVIGRPHTFVLIWTTTPWTLPANLAVAYNSTFQYVQVRVGTENYILFRGLLPGIAEKCGWSGLKEEPVSANELAKLEYQHPFIPARKGRLFPGDSFVTSDTGTGFVHIAPGHGLEDYGVGLQNGLPIYSPVDDDGRFVHTNDLPVEQQMPPEMVGKSILEKHGKSDANEAVLHELRLRHALLHQENYHHSYPHCWRSKTPVIFRAMDQWFVRIDHVAADVRRLKSQSEGSQSLDTSAATFRKEALSEIDRVKWIPDWGVNRIKGAVESRPDWCISRQRSWGVPIPAFYDAKGNAILDAPIVRNAADLIEQHGSNVWFEKSAAELWSLVKPKDWKGPEAAAKSNDTLDVWIDSGSSSRSVLMRRPELNSKLKTQNSKLPWQAEMYLEGSDQHRGWFQSSLLLSLAGNGAAPFKTVLTHGFMVDADREKISKSKQGQGGYEKPQTSEAYVKKYGADVVRLWVASQDFRNDIIVSEERIGKVGETYRGIRNALRYQLSNLYDFDPAKHTVADDKLTGLDRWILGEFAKLEQEVLEAYDRFEFHVVYQKLSQFVAVELSAIYHDAIKDRMYTDAANSHRRRSTQTALLRLVTGLCRMLAPVLAFTADEAWAFVPKSSGSVHELQWQAHGLALPSDEIKKWDHLKQWRERILPELEKARQAKHIGKALEAKVAIAVPEAEFAFADKELLRELVNVSALDISKGEPAAPRVAKADGQKCERCWHWETDVGSDPQHPTICARCVKAVKADQGLTE
jgi:isoleucyl-tRNA synthetase